ncbi:MAG: 30S ribosomal protein S17 [Candidatus Muproteobacteria bacterium RBG_19FT_COMBO_61_10]|jgi:small subunit ribosomal protein S17|uniref:Small ribosomal subunit protein uS17 n=1 Tax=Candidatus Muproteobacteria bacterium RBG_19FT_COMBO_61_10 TaxID=1817761 RepID=A0A1F6UHD7_9PROT|nr:MAG: 30S ribosomal protein S17 [Candidatus Muproteobacteria bacterium RBG_19FT_COMBO_61_10]
MSEDTKLTCTVSGRVSSNKMDKTITVVVERQVRHPLYGKFIRRRTKLHAHDENNDCGEGDLVMIQECRPLSRTKTWRLVKVLEKAVVE